MAIENQIVSRNFLCYLRVCMYSYLILRRGLSTVLSICHRPGKSKNSALQFPHLASSCNNTFCKLFSLALLFSFLFLFLLSTYFPSPNPFSHGPYQPPQLLLLDPRVAAASAKTPIPTHPSLKL